MESTFWFVMPAYSAGSGAELSNCGTYRWRLWRDHLLGDYAKHNGPVCWIMLNPSTADAFKDDPTIRRIIGFTMRWGYDALEVGHPYECIETDRFRMALNICFCGLHGMSQELQRDAIGLRCFVSGTIPQTIFG